MENAAGPPDHRFGECPWRIKEEDVEENEYTLFYESRSPGEPRGERDIPEPFFIKEEPLDEEKEDEEWLGPNHSQTIGGGHFLAQVQALSREGKEEDERLIYIWPEDDSEVEAEATEVKEEEEEEHWRDPPHTLYFRSDERTASAAETQVLLKKLVVNEELQKVLGNQYALGEELMIIEDEPEQCGGGAQWGRENFEDHATDAVKPRPYQLFEDLEEKADEEEISVCDTVERQEERKEEDTVRNDQSNSPQPLEAQLTEQTQQTAHAKQSAHCAARPSALRPRPKVPKGRKLSREKVQPRCNSCQRTFNYWSDYRVHIRTHTGERPFKCFVCGKGFVRIGDLNKHVDIHSGKKPFSCDYCDASFARQGQLKTHERIHTGIRPFSCHLCAKSFTQKCSLERHIQSHSPKKRFICEICGGGFTEKGHLVVHQRSHTGLRPYKCDKCSSSFSTSTHLKRHKFLHTGIKPFKCSICHKRFAGKWNCKRHVQKHEYSDPDDEDSDLQTLN